MFIFKSVCFLPILNIWISHTRLIYNKQGRPRYYLSVLITAFHGELPRLNPLYSFLFLATDTHRQTQTNSFSRPDSAGKKLHALRAGKNIIFYPTCNNRESADYKLCQQKKDLFCSPSAYDCIYYLATDIHRLTQT